MVKKKKKIKKVKKKIGRKWFDGLDEEKVIADCKDAWKMGCPDSEAAVIAGVSAFSLCRYLKVHPQLAEFRKTLQEFPNYSARKTVVGSLAIARCAFR